MCVFGPPDLSDQVPEPNLSSRRTHYIPSLVAVLNLRLGCALSLQSRVFYLRVPY